MEPLPKLTIYAFLALCAAVASCGHRRPITPDLTTAAAAEQITRAPEFSRYAELLAVDSATREGDSLADCCYRAYFTFRYRTAGVNVAPIKAHAEFRYWDAVWHFTHFSYGCPEKCQSVTPATPPLKGRTPY